jgi:hypothetical protein
MNESTVFPEMHLRGEDRASFLHAKVAAGVIRTVRFDKPKALGRLAAVTPPRPVSSSATNAIGEEAVFSSFTAPGSPKATEMKWANTAASPEIPGATSPSARPSVRATLIGPNAEVIARDVRVASHCRDKGDFARIIEQGVPETCEIQAGR